MNGLPKHRCCPFPVGRHSDMTPVILGGVRQPAEFPVCGKKELPISATKTATHGPDRQQYWAGNRKQYQIGSQNASEAISRCASATRRTSHSDGPNDPYKGQQKAGPFDGAGPLVGSTLGQSSGDWRRRSEPTAAGPARPSTPQGMIRCTGLPRIETAHVVVSLAALMLYSICHQPSSSVTSPGGFSPFLP